MLHTYPLLEQASGWGDEHSRDAMQYVYPLSEQGPKIYCTGQSCRDRDAKPGKDGKVYYNTEIDQTETVAYRCEKCDIALCGACLKKGCRPECQDHGHVYSQQTTLQRFITKPPQS